MTDLALFWDNERGHADLRVAGSDLVMSDDLESAVIISLFTDRRAPDDVELPAGDDRRGWWGDSYPDREGDEMGSLLWLLEREKETQEVLERSRIYARQALAWMIEDRVVSQMRVEAGFGREPGLRWLAVYLTLPTGQQRTLRYEYSPTTAPDPFAEPEGTPGEIRGTGGPAPIVAAGWAAAAAGPAGEIQGTPGTEPMVATSWAPGAAGKPGEIHGASGVSAIDADAWTPQPAAKPGEIQGASGIPAIEADAWTPDPMGLGGQVGCGQQLGGLMTWDRIDITWDNDTITWDTI